MQFVCNPTTNTPALYALTAQNGVDDTFAAPVSLLSINPTTGATRTLCRIDDTSSGSHVIVPVNETTLLYFSGDVSPSMSTLAVNSDGSVASEGGLCLLSAVVQYSVVAASAFHGAAVSAALPVNDGVRVFGVVGREVVLIGVEGGVQVIANLTSGAGTHEPVTNVSSFIWTNPCAAGGGCAALVLLCCEPLPSFEAPVFP